MALSLLYLMEHWLIDMLLGRLRSEHAKDIEIAVLRDQLDVLRRQVKRTRVPARRPCAPRGAEPSASPPALVDLPGDPGHDPAGPGAVTAAASVGRRDRLGGLVHEYYQVAA
jgi:hypothetical protein